MKNNFGTPHVYKLCRSSLRLLTLSRPFSPAASKSVISTAITDKVTLTVNYFDRVLGIAEVRAAQSVVTEAEEEFMKSRRSVQESRTELVQLQSQLRELRSKLDRIAREDERYLQLATEEHRVLIDEKKLKTDLEGFAALERDNFAALSGAVRNAHEKERSRAERTKYWSIIGSACGAVLGILGSTVINIKRMKQIKLTVEENNQAFMAKTSEELKMIVQSVHEKSPTSANSPGNELALSQEEPGNEFVMSNENSKLLNEIHAKVEKLSETDSVKDLALLIEELKQNLLQANNLKVKLIPLSENSTTFLGFERDLGKILWWSKAGMAASLIAGVSCSLLYTFYR